MALLVSNVAWSESSGDPVALAAKALRVRVQRVLSAVVVKRSLDARQREKRWIAVLRVEVDDEEEVLARRVPGVTRMTAKAEGRYGVADVGPTRVSWTGSRPIVVGAGPAGLFAALWLAEAGAPVLLLERGGPVESRVDAVNGFWRRKLPLDPENNLVFGEGGAGTFSDGKIYTRRRDGDLGYVFRNLVRFGADPEVLREGWAHLGTDRIRAILPAFRERIREAGGEIRFNARVSRLVVEAGRCVGVELADGERVTGGPVVVACGHSARDAIQMMIDAGAAATSRGIKVGVRIEHPQALIDRGRYGSEDRGALPPASYRMAFNPAHGRSAHTFCMCPGGMVVPASNHDQRMVVNGMSFAARRAFWANSAVIVEVDAREYGAADPMAGFRYQDAIEAKAYLAAGSTGAAPAQRVVDLREGRTSADLPRSSFPMGLASSDLRAFLPDYLVGGLLAALEEFERTIPGFAGPEALLIAPETRTTSPLQFERDERQCSTTVADLYPTGEGAGYGGGIASCALDGIRAARAISGS